MASDKRMASDITAILLKFEKRLQKLQKKWQEMGSDKRNGKKWQVTKEWQEMASDKRNGK